MSVHLSPPWRSDVQLALDEHFGVRGSDCLLLLLSQCVTLSGILKNESSGTQGAAGYFFASVGLFYLLNGMSLSIRGLREIQCQAPVTASRTPQLRRMVLKCRLVPMSTRSTV